jgi:hypothetical protein
MLCNAANGFSSLFFAARQTKETRLGGKRVGFLLRFNKQQLFDDDDDDNEEEEEEEVELVLGDNDNKECALMRV